MNRMFVSGTAWVCLLMCSATGANAQELGIRVLADSQKDAWFADEPTAAPDVPAHVFDEMPDERRELHSHSAVTRFLNWRFVGGLGATLSLGVLIVWNSCRRRPRNPVPIVSARRTI